MDFTLTEDQELVRDTARHLLSRECPPTLVRAYQHDPSAADTLDKRLGEWAGLAGGNLVDLCLFCEEAGAVSLPGAFFPTVALYAPLLAALDHPLLPAVLAGQATGTVAMAGRAGQWVPTPDPVKCFVPEPERVDHVAVVSPGAQPSGPVRVAIHERPAATYTAGVDWSRRLCTVDTSGHPAESFDLDAAALEAILERAVVALSASLVGTARTLLERALAYAKERVQFERPIGSFQAIKHKLANMALAWERAWSAAYYAAMCVDAGDEDRHRATHVAKIVANEAAGLCARDGIQIHGGIGYTWEHDLHLFIRRAYGDMYLLGTTEWHQDRLADLLLPAAP